MAITLRQEALYLKDANTGQYKNPAILFSDIGETEATVKANVQQTGTDQINAINTRATQVAASLPTSGEMEAMVASPFVSGTYEEGDYVIQPDNGVNKLYIFTDDHVGAWTGTDAQEVKLTDIISSIEALVDIATVNETISYLDINIDEDVQPTD